MKNHLKTAFAAIANPIFGTWQIMGLHLPDVRTNDATQWLHKKLTQSADIKSLAWLRVGIMDVFQRAAQFREKGHKLNPAQKTKFRFFDEQGTSVNELPRSLLFTGSGNDEYRKFDTAVKELRCFMRAQLGQKMPELENGPISHAVKEAGLEETILYLPEASSTLNHSSAWFERPKEAYLLNVRPDYASPAAREFVKTHFLPLVSEQDENGNTHKIDADTASLNMRFTLTGQSYGGTSIQMHINALYEELNALDYDDEEIQTIFDNIFVLNLSGAAFAADRLDRPSPKTVFVEHIYDFVGFQTDRHDTHPYFHGDKALDENGIALSENRHFFWRDFHWRDENHRDGVAQPLNEPYGYHDIRAVLSDLPQPVRNALLHALTNKGRLPPLNQMFRQNIPQGHDLTMHQHL